MAKLVTSQQIHLVGGKYFHILVADKSDPTASSPYFRAAFQTRSGNMMPVSRRVTLQTGSYLIPFGGGPTGVKFHPYLIQTLDSYVRESLLLICI